MQLLHHLTFHQRCYAYLKCTTRKISKCALLKAASAASRSCSRLTPLQSRRAATPAFVWQTPTILYHVRGTSLPCSSWRNHTPLTHSPHPPPPPLSPLPSIPSKPLLPSPFSPPIAAAIGCFYAAVASSRTMDVAVTWGQNLAKGAATLQKNAGKTCP
jgi:hypothetical protein